MTVPIEQPGRLRDYLLGTMDDTAAAALEDRYFQEAAAFDALDDALDALTDDYVRGDLTPDDRRRFERLHLTGRSGRSRVEFSRALHRSAATTKTPARPPFMRSLLVLVRQQAAPLQLALAAGVLIMLAGPTLALTRLSQLGSAVGELRSDLDAERAAARSASVDAAREREQRRHLETTLARATTSSFALLPGSTRGGGTRLLLPVGIGFARFELALERTPPLPLRVAVRTVGGATVWSVEVRDSIGASGLTVTVPNAVLSEGEYEVTVGAVGRDGRIDEVANYAFRIDRP